MARNLGAIGLLDFLHFFGLFVSVVVVVAFFAMTDDGATLCDPSNQCYVENKYVYIHTELGTIESSLWAGGRWSQRRALN